MYDVRCATCDVHSFVSFPNISAHIGKWSICVCTDEFRENSSAPKYSIRFECSKLALSVPVFIHNLHSTDMSLQIFLKTWIVSKSEWTKVDLQIGHKACALHRSRWMFWERQNERKQHNKILAGELFYPDFWHRHISKILCSHHYVSVGFWTVLCAT